MNQAVSYSTALLNYSCEKPSVVQFEPPSDAPFNIRPIDRFDERLKMKIQTAVRLTAFEIFWIKKGEGCLTVDTAQHDIGENTIYCIAPGQLRQIQETNNIEGYYISFSEDFLNLTEDRHVFSFWSARYGGNQCYNIIKVDEELQNEIELVMLKMIKEVGHYYVLRSEILKCLLQTFIIYMSRKIDFSYNDAMQGKDMEAFRKFMALLKQHFTTKKMVADYAKELYITPNYLNQIVKKVSGFTASHHIQQQIILEAKQKAMYSHLTMKEVAYALGFNDCVHFSRFFKTNSGENFTTFKKSKACKSTK